LSKSSRMFLERFIFSKKSPLPKRKSFFPKKFSSREVLFQEGEGSFPKSSPRGSLPFYRNLPSQESPLSRRRKFLLREKVQAWKLCDVTRGATRRHDNPISPALLVSSYRFYLRRTFRYGGMWATMCVREELPCPFEANSWRFNSSNK